MANGSRHALYIVPEVTFGTTPATPALMKVRHNSCTLGVSKNLLRSEEIRDDRMNAGNRYGTRQASGEIALELTHGGSVHTLLEAVLCGTWTTNVLKAGTTRRSFSVLRNYGDLGAGNKPFHLFAGQELNTFKLSMSTEGLLVATFGVVGKGNPALGEAAPTGATYPAVTTGLPFDSFSGTINEGGTPIAVVTEVELNLENGIEPRFTVGSKDMSLRPSIGRANVTGSMTAHFETGALLDKFINETNSALDFTVGDGTNTLKFDIPNLKYTGGQPDVSGDGPIMLTMPFEAELHTGSASNIVVTRSGA